MDDQCSTCASYVSHGRSNKDCDCQRITAQELTPNDVREAIEKARIMQAYIGDNYSVHKSDELFRYSDVLETIITAASRNSQGVEMGTVDIENELVNAKNELDDASPKAAKYAVQHIDKALELLRKHTEPKQ